MRVCILRGVGNEMKLGPSDRTEATQARYQFDIDNNLLVGIDKEPALIQYQNWKVILNAYGADKRWKLSMMYVNTNGHCWDDVTKDEAWELHCLKLQWREAFDEIKDNGVSTSSVPGLAHGHMYKERIL